MKKLLASIIFFLMLIPVWADTGTHSFSSTLTEMEKFYPAEENSENEILLRGYIKQSLSDAGISSSEVPLDVLSDRHSFSKNIYARIPGNSENHLIIAAPLNGEKGNAVNVAAALELAKLFAAGSSEQDVKILFLGAETGRTEGHPIGTNVFIRNEYNEKSSVIYFNFSSVPGKTVLRTGNNRAITPYRMVKNINNALLKSGLDYSLRAEQNILYNLGMILPPSPLDTYLDADIPALMFLSSPGDTHPDADKWFDGFSVCMSDFAEKTAVTWDSSGKNYFVVKLSNGYTVISESYLLFFFLAVSVIVIFYITFHAKQSGLYLKRIFKYFYLIPWTALTVFIFYSISTYLIVGFLRLTHLESQWQKIIPEIFILKCTVCVLLLTAIAPFFKKLKRANLGSFYSGSAVVTAILDLLIFIFIDFSFAIYFIWGLLWIFVFTLHSSRRIKFLCMILAGTFLILATHGIIFYPAINLAGDLIFSSATINFLITMISLPYIFMGIRIFFVLPPKMKFRHKISRIAALVGVIVITILSVRFIYTYSPYGKENLQIIRAQQEIDADKDTGTLFLESSYKLGSLRINYGDEQFDINTDNRRISIDTKKPEFEASFSEETRYFLERKTVKLKIDAEGKADKLIVTLIPKNPENRILVLDSTYPHMAEGNNIKFRIGQNQPMPFEMEITTPKDTEFSVEIIVRYAEPPFSFGAEGENKKCIPFFTLKKSLL